MGRHHLRHSGTRGDAFRRVGTNTRGAKSELAAEPRPINHLLDPVIVRAHRRSSGDLGAAWLVWTHPGLMA